MASAMNSGSRRSAHGPLFLYGKLREVGDAFPQESKDPDQGLRGRHDGRRRLALQNESSVAAFDGGFLLFRQVDRLGVIVGHDS